MMLIDTHSHLNFKEFDKDREEVVKRTLDEGVSMINVGTNYETSKKAVEIAGRYNEGVWAAIGLHPLNISKLKSQNSKSQLKTQNPEDILEEDFNQESYYKLAQLPRVVAIGEVGLDYWKVPKTAEELEMFKEKQKEILLKQLELAKELNLPVIFHCRKAHDDLLELLKITIEQFNNRAIRAVVHCFTGKWRQAERYLEMGFYLGFDGIIFKLNLDKIIKKTPLDRILVETDSPFLTPPISVNQFTPLDNFISNGASQRKSAVIRNEPIFVKYVVQKIAEIKKESFEKIAKITTENAETLFCLL